MKNLAIIPARGGSKRIPRKNIKPFMGKPIIAYSIEAALQSGLFDEVMVSTDDEEIADIARQYGAVIPFMRSAETANDHATTVDVLIEVLEKYNEKNRQFDNACCIYSTAPFITVENLKSALDLQIRDNLDSVFATVQFSYPIQRALKLQHGKICMMWPEYLNSRSQDLESTYHDAGQFYMFNIDRFRINKKLWTSNSGTITLSEIQVQDLDTFTDWQMAEMKYQIIKKLTSNVRN